MNCRENPDGNSSLSGMAVDASPLGAGNEVELRAKSGKSLARYFPDVVATLRPFAPNRFVLDGELAIPIGNTLSFDALQARLHPAGVACAN